MKPVPRRRIALAGLLLALSLDLAAHGGHVHGGDEPSAPAAAPASAQDAVAVRSASRGWPARVVVDRRASLVIAAPEAGTVLPPPAGWPLPGQRVQAGELLGRLLPATRQLARRDLEIELVEARKDEALGALQIERYGITDAQRFDVSLPTQTLQILTDHEAAAARSSRLAAGLGAPIEIRAPRAGTLLRVDADASRTVADGAVLFTIASGAAALVVELRAAADDVGAPRIATAVLDDGSRLPLTRIASGYDAAARLHVAHYAPASGDAGLIVNQRLRVHFGAASDAAPPP